MISVIPGTRRRALGLAVAALLGSALAAGAQQPVPPRDTLAPRRPTPDSIRIPIPIRADTVPMDSSQRRRVLAIDSNAARRAADTIKAPLGRPSMPPSLAIGERYRWTRDELFATGANTVADLLERIPGITSFRTGWMSTPTVATYLGDGRMRVFYDGVELDILDDRVGGVPDLVEVQLWTLEDLVVERAPGEIRVHMTSWRVDRTPASTRTDIATGDEDTNLYRGFYGKRFSHGEALQIGAQQYSTESARSTAGGDQLSLLTRVGWARGAWHTDAFLLRSARNRSAQATLLADSVLSGLDAMRTDAYVRAGYGQPDHGFWFQLIAASQAFNASTLGETTTSGRTGALNEEDVAALRGTPVRTIASSRSRTQYVGSGGVTFGGMQLGVTARMRVFQGQHLLSPAARLSYDREWLQLVVHAERRQGDSVETNLRAGVRLSDSIRVTDIADASVIVRPLPWIALGGGAGIRRAEGGRFDADEVKFLRAEGAVRVAGLWVGGGILQRDESLLPAPLVFNDRFAAVREPRSVGTFGLLRGRIWRAINADIVATVWDSDSISYRPRYQARGEIFARTEWRRKFPTGNFGLLASVRQDYRSRAHFPLVDGDTATTEQSHVWSSRLEIRIVNAVIFWHYNNFLGERYQLVPNFEMPGQVNLYGVRWQFWN